jgi:segregation and condensation protein B
MSAPDSDGHSFPVGPAEDPDRFASATGEAAVPKPHRPLPEPEGVPAEPSPSQPAAGARGGSGVAGPMEAERNGFRRAEVAAPAVAATGGPMAPGPSAPPPAVAQVGEGSAVAGDGDAAAGAEPGDESSEADGVVASVGPESGAADVWPPDEALEAVELDDAGWTRRSVEAILLVADEPVPAATLAELVGARLTEVEALLIDLAGEYAAQARGFVLRAVAGGWRLYTHPATREVVEAYLRSGQQSRLTRAALETLAVVAYRQPVTRHQVAAVRGVNVDGVFRTLATRGLIHEVGHEEGPGQAVLYATTPAFLEQLGLNSLDQLPPIKDYLPDGVDLTELLEQM